MSIGTVSFDFTPAVHLIAIGLALLTVQAYGIVAANKFDRSTIH